MQVQPQVMVGELTVESFIVNWHCLVDDWIIDSWRFQPFCNGHDLVRTEAQPAPARPWCGSSLWSPQSHGFLVETNRFYGEAHHFCRAFSSFYLFRITIYWSDQLKPVATHSWNEVMLYGLRVVKSRSGVSSYFTWDQAISDCCKYIGDIM